MARRRARAGGVGEGHNCRRWPQARRVSTCNRLGRVPGVASRTGSHRWSVVPGLADAAAGSLL